MSWSSCFTPERSECHMLMPSQPQWKHLWHCSPEKTEPGHCPVLDGECWDWSFPLLTAMARDTPASSVLPKWPQKTVLTKLTAKLINCAIICGGGKESSSLSPAPPGPGILPGHRLSLPPVPPTWTSLWFRFWNQREPTCGCALARRSAWMRRKRRASSARRGAGHPCFTRLCGTLATEGHFRQGCGRRRVGSSSMVMQEQRVGLTCFPHARRVSHAHTRWELLTDSKGGEKFTNLLVF